MQLPNGKTRLDMVREGLVEGVGKKRGRLVVSISRLKEDPRNERRTFRNMEGLISSVKAVGLIEPITVTPEDGEEGSYRIVTGHRRFRASKAAGLEQVEILIRDPEDERTRRVKSIVSNVQREDVGPVEMSEALQSLLDEGEHVASQDELAKLIGKDKSWVSGMLRILTLPVALQQKVGTSHLSVSYDTMIRIARLDDAAEQERLIDALLTGATAREIRSQINQVKGRPAGGSHADPKPKEVFRTEQKATVIVQSQTKSLTPERTISALQEALAIARKKQNAA